MLLDAVDDGAAGEGLRSGPRCCSSSSRRAPRRRSPRRRRRRRRRGCSGDGDGWTWRHPRPRGLRGGRGALRAARAWSCGAPVVRFGRAGVLRVGTTRTAAEPGPATGGTYERAEERRGARPRGRVRRPWRRVVVRAARSCARRCGARRRAVRRRRHRSPAAAASRRRPARPCRARRRAVPARRSAAQRPAVATIQSELRPRARRPTMAADGEDVAEDEQRAGGAEAAVGRGAEAALRVGTADERDARLIQAHREQRQEHEGSEHQGQTGHRIRNVGFVPASHLKVLLIDGGQSGCRAALQVGGAVARARDAARFCARRAGLDAAASARRALGRRRGGRGPDGLRRRPTSASRWW